MTNRRIPWMHAAGWVPAMLAVPLLVTYAWSQGQPGRQTDSSASPVQKAHQLIAEGKTQAAIAEYEAVVAADPANAEAQGNLGVLQFFANDCADALPHLLAAYKLGAVVRGESGLGKAGPGKTGLGKAGPGESGSGESGSGEAGARIQALAGICQKRAGELDQADHNLSDSLPLVKNPKIHLLILSNLSDIEYARGDVQRASQDIGELMTADPNNPDVLYLAYRIYGDLAESARNRLTLLGPDSGRIHLLMAEEFIKAGDATSAIHQYELAMASDPTLTGVHFELGEAILSESLNEDSLNRAAMELELALKQDPRNAGAAGKLGVIEGLRGHAASAEELYTRALSLKSDQLDALLGLGGVYRDRGDYEKAAGFYARAVQASPLDESIHLRLAQTYRDLNRKAEADSEMKLFEQIKDLKKKSSLAQARRTGP